MPPREFQVVVIEDSVKDLQTATHVLQSVGIQAVTTFSRIPEAMLFLEDIAAGGKECPDLILLDLNLGNDSGFEVLRFYKSTPSFHKCQILVWTGSGAIEKELCIHFGVECIPKEEGAAALATMIWNRASKKAS
ncbi:MAG TPA: response regulator [Candidatus Angelobacter sp.]|nr:response regulator [Candidatus Angelobacter sp.]